MRARSLVLLLVVVFSLVFVDARAQWQPTAAPVCTAGNDQLSPTMIPDGAGGAILTWFDYRNNGVAADIFAQRVNALGVPLWTANGVAICIAVDHQAAPVIVPDGGTGAIIAWYDTRNGTDTDIYVQRVNAAGVVQWAANGVALSTAGGSQIFCDIASDGAGGAIVVWEDHRGSGGVGDIYARRVNASGVPQWAADGVVVCGAGADQLNPKIVSDGAGGAIIAWPDFRTPGNQDLYAQRVNAAGAAQWTANGVSLCGALGDQYSMMLVSDGSNGVIAAWQDERVAFDSDIYAQRLNGTGAPQWTLDGAVVVSAPNAQESVAIAPDGAAGAIFAWDDYRTGGTPDIYVQRIAAGGTIQWQTGGLPICTAANYQTNPLITADGTGGAVIVWRDVRSFVTTDEYAQHVNGFGITQWAPDGAQLTVAPAASSINSIIWDGSGGAITAHYDYRNGAPDIYAQRVDGHFGYWGHPEPVITSVADVPKDQGGFVAVNWTASGRDVPNPRTIGHYSIWRAVTVLPLNMSMGSLVQDIASVEPDTKGPVYAIAATTDYYWELVGTQSAHGFAGYSFAAPTRADSVAGNAATERFMIAAHDTYDDYVAFASNVGTGRSVDNLAPATPLLLTIQQSGSNAVLNWKPVADADVARYTLYRKNGAGVQPVPINFLVDETLPNHTDVGAAAGGFFYVVTATDSHGNQSAPSNEVSLTGSTGAGDTPSITSLMVLQNSPNPFSTSAEFELGLPRDEDVTMEIYDIAGRRVASREMGVMEKGWRKVALEARDNTGHALPSGVYFYRVKAAGETLTRKMVIAR